MAIRNLSVPEKHQLRIARDTLKMSPEMAGVMGGPTVAEAVDIIERLTGERYLKPVDFLKGQAHQTPYGWFANPRGSDVQAIPCTSIFDAANTIDRLGVRR